MPIKPLLYMRKKSLMGENFGDYAGMKGNVSIKSAGGFIERDSGGVPLTALIDSTTLDPLVDSTTLDHLIES